MGLNEAQKKERSDYLERNLNITECSQKKPYAFISYASDNWETVFKTAVVPMQQKYGLCVYADKAFDKVNDKWIVPMLRNIRGSDLMIAFVSQSYIESYACFLELLTAVNNKKQIVFVSLEQDLHLGDTTDLPNVERGVKNEILNQGANIATNTNNTSNDLMRAMKSAYTSISTLLEQDALSKYDISDAFINFFRDASINRKSINDLGAVRGTIESVSSKVFDESLVSKFGWRPSPISIPKAAPKTDDAPVQSKPAPQPVQTEPSPQPAQSKPALQPIKTAAAPQQEQTSQPSEFVYGEQPAPTPATEYVSAPESQYSQPQNSKEPLSVKLKNTMSKLKLDKGSKKIKAAVIACVCCLAVIIAAVIIVSPKNVENMSYTSPHGGVGIYTGKWKNDQPVGKGTIRWSNGNVYTGEWKNGLPNGQGSIEWNNGDSYVGGWKDDIPNGKGTYTWTNGAVYSGGFKDGYLSGHGRYTQLDGQVFEGEYKDGKSNGYGTCKYANGDYYEGEWVNSYPSGEGTMKYANGDVYTGTWKNGMLNGYGTYTWANGDVHYGEWVDGKAHGQGTKKLTTGEVYAGVWEDGNYVG